MPDRTDQQDIQEIFDLLHHQKTVSTYTARLITIVRALFNSEDFDTFVAEMTEVVELQLNDGWFLAMKNCGFAKDEISEEQDTARQALIDISLASIDGFGEDILSAKENGGKASDFNPRIAIWANRYDEAFNQATTLACGDKKQKWVIDPTIDNCKTCLKLNGKVKRASTWAASGVYPQATNGSLDCNGFNCGCDLVDTDEPLSRGPLPSVP